MHFSKDNLLVILVSHSHLSPWSEVKQSDRVHGFYRPNIRCRDFRMTLGVVFSGINERGHMRYKLQHVHMTPRIKSSKMLPKRYSLHQ